jgi:hypothetical protein
MREEWNPRRYQLMRDYAEQYGVPLEVVRALADMLGPDEDYDGLVNALEDYEWTEW